MLKPRFRASSNNLPASTTRAAEPVELRDHDRVRLAATQQRASTSLSTGRLSARLPDFTSSRTATSSQPRCAHAASDRRDLRFQPEPGLDPARRC